MQQILFYGMPHPAVRAVFRYVAAIVAAAGGPAVVLETGADLPRGHEQAIHIRSEAVDALDLAAHAGPAGDDGRPAGLVLAARLDAAWRDLPRLSIETAMTQEAYALAFLAEQGGLAIDAATLAAARAGFRGLAADPLSRLNPLSFIAMLEAEPSAERVEPLPPPPMAGERLRARGFAWRGGAAAVEGGEAPTMLLDALRLRPVRTVLVLSPDPAAAVRDIAPRLPSRITLAVAGPEGTEAPGEAPRAYLHATWDALPDLSDVSLDLVHLHHAEGWDWLDRLLPWARAQLPRHGLLTGTEASGEALAAVVSRLTGDGRGDGISFALGERQWRAVPHAWWSA